jgi:catechol 2,3-dioxygenase-like lactoylglutathione lyase family enzyme
MFIQGLNHVNIRVKDPAATFAFFVEVLGMTAERWPEGKIARGGRLLDAAGNDILHIGGADSPYPSDQWRPFDAEITGGPVHHVALSCAGYNVLCERLDKLGVAYRRNEIPQMNLRQLFVVEPGGVMLELNFRGD